MTLCILSFFKDVAEVNLDKVLDHDRKSELHLGKIADAMIDWKGKIAEHLHLSLPDIEEIKMAHPTRLDLQKYENIKYTMSILGSSSGTWLVTKVKLIMSANSDPCI